jgi:hypothetical protein
MPPFKPDFWLTHQILNLFFSTQWALGTGVFYVAAIRINLIRQISPEIFFALTAKKCCDDCSDLFCGLLNDPLQDVKPVQPAPELGYPDSSYAVFAQPAGICRGQPLPSEPWPLFAFEIVSNPVPLYIEHLSLII